MKKTYIEEEIYHLWWEYLKESKDYKDLCEFNRKNKCRLVEIPERYRSGDKAVHFRKLGIVYKKFGDIHLSTFEEWWKIFKKHLLALNNPSQKMLVEDYSEIVSRHMEACIASFFEEYQREPELFEFIDDLPERIKKASPPNHLYIVINVSGGAPADIGNQIEKMARRLKKDLKNDPRLKQLELNEKRRRCDTVGNRRPDECRGYLEVYKYRTQGLAWKDVLLKVRPRDFKKALQNNMNIKSDKYDNLIRAINDDFDKANRIIKNVEHGEFPGIYD